MLAQKPTPVADDVSRPFWDGVDEQQLRAQRCSSCERMQHPPAPNCRHCGGGTLVWTTLSGQGTIYSFEVVHDTRVEQFKLLQPYVVLVVQSAESPDVLFIANLASPDERPRIGARVEVAYEEIEPGGQFLPQFRLTAGDVR